MKKFSVSMVIALMALSVSIHDANADRFMVTPGQQFFYNVGRSAGDGLRNLIMGTQNLLWNMGQSLGQAARNIGQGISNGLHNMQVQAAHAAQVRAQNQANYAHLAAGRRQQLEWNYRHHTYRP